MIENIKIFGNETWNLHFNKLPLTLVHVNIWESLKFFVCKQWLYSQFT